MDLNTGIINIENLDLDSMKIDQDMKQSLADMLSESLTGIPLDELKNITQPLKALTDTERFVLINKLNDVGSYLEHKHGKDDNQDAKIASDRADIIRTTTFSKKCTIDHDAKLDWNIIHKVEIKMFGEAMPIIMNRCMYCTKYGHWDKCWKFLNDKTEHKKIQFDVGEVSRTDPVLGSYPCDEYIKVEVPE